MALGDLRIPCIRVHVNVTLRTSEAVPAVDDTSESVDAFEHTAHVFLTSKLSILFLPAGTFSTEASLRSSLQLFPGPVSNAGRLLVSRLGPYVVHLMSAGNEALTRPFPL